MEFKEFVGKTFVEITGKKGDDEIIFTEDNGKQYRMYHEQDCCENVYVEDICGELDWLIGKPIINAREDTSNENPNGIP